MRYATLPQMPLSPSVICLGTHAFGSDLDTQTAFHLLDTYFEHGGNFLDTAQVYGAWLPHGLGLSERVIGQWMRERRCREQVILATKGGHPDLAAMAVPRLSRQDILADLAQSLKFLQVEIIDLYWLHRDDPHQPIADLLETLAEQVTQGKIRAFGCANWSLARLEEAYHYAKTHGISSFIGNQCMWSYAVPNRDALADQSMIVMDAPTRQFHQNADLAIVAYTAQANGYFSKLSRDTSTLSDTLKKIYTNEENTKRLARVQKIGHDLSLPIAAVTLAYLTNQKPTTFPITSSTNAAHLLESMRAGDVELSSDVIHFLEYGSEIC